MKKSILFALAGATWLLASAASAQPDQPAATTQPTSSAPAAQPTSAPASAAPTVQPAQPAAPATTQPARPPKQIYYGDPCRADLEKFCVDSRPLVIRMKCLDSHEAEFAEACQKRRAELRDLRTACQPVIDQSCRYVPLFADAILNCLQEHESDIVEPCKGLREKALKPAHFISPACQADFKKFCKDVPMKGLSIAQCLQEHLAELSKPCLTGAPEK